MVSAVKTAPEKIAGKPSKKKGRVTSIDEHVGQRLRQRRSLMGMSQEKLAEAVGVTFQQVQKYENGANRVSAGRLYEFSKLLDTPISYFFDSAPEVATAAPLSAPGFAEGEQSPFAGEEDILKKKETLELVRVYYSIRNPKLRKDLFKLVKSMAENMRTQDTDKSS